ncbi:MAG: hypothetical protein IPO35_16650 [Uliginosibacterium sp.]|nr:hypothetical protein [Uliginosibacterium sp.]
MELIAAMPVAKQRGQPVFHQAEFFSSAIVVGFTAAVAEARLLAPETRRRCPPRWHGQR